MTKSEIQLLFDARDDLIRELEYDLCRERDYDLKFDLLYSFAKDNFDFMDASIDEEEFIKNISSWNIFKHLKP